MNQTASSWGGARVGAGRKQMHLGSMALPPEIKVQLSMALFATAKRGSVAAMKTYLAGTPHGSDT